MLDGLISFGFEVLLLPPINFLKVHKVPKLIHAYNLSVKYKRLEIVRQFIKPKAVVLPLLEKCLKLLTEHPELLVLRLMIPAEQRDIVFMKVDLCTLAIILNLCDYVNKAITTFFILPLKMLNNFIR